MVKNQTGRKVKVLRSDNGGEYTSQEFKDYLTSKGINHQLSISTNRTKRSSRAHESNTYRACPQYQITA